MALCVGGVCAHSRTCMLSCSADSSISLCRIPISLQTYWHGSQARQLFDFPPPPPPPVNSFLTLPFQPPPVGGGAAGAKGGGQTSHIPRMFCELQLPRCLGLEFFFPKQVLQPSAGWIHSIRMWAALEVQRAILLLFLLAKQQAIGGT